MHNLETRELITSRMAKEYTDMKGGARRKYFLLTPKGLQALIEVKRDESRDNSEWNLAVEVRNG